MHGFSRNTVSHVLLAMQKNSNGRAKIYKSEGACWEESATELKTTFLNLTFGRASALVREDHRAWLGYYSCHVFGSLVPLTIYDAAWKLSPRRLLRGYQISRQNSPNQPAWVFRPSIHGFDLDVPWARHGYSQEPPHMPVDLLVCVMSSLQTALPTISMILSLTFDDCSIRRDTAARKHRTPLASCVCAVSSAWRTCRSLRSIVLVQVNRDYQFLCRLTSSSTKHNFHSVLLMASQFRCR